MNDLDMEIKAFNYKHSCFSQSSCLLFCSLTLTTVGYCGLSVSALLSIPKHLSTQN